MITDHDDATTVPHLERELHAAGVLRVRGVCGPQAAVRAQVAPRGGGEGGQQQRGGGGGGGGHLQTVDSGGGEYSSR